MNLRYLLWEAAVEKHCGSTDEKLVTFFTEEIIDRWPCFGLSIRLAIQQHVEYTFELDRTDRYYGHAWKALGTDATKALWEKVRVLWEVKPDAVFADIDKGINYTVIAIESAINSVVYKDDSDFVRYMNANKFTQRYAKV